MFYFFYYFPLGLDLRPRRAVWATWALLGACVATFLLQRLLPVLFWANYGALVFVPGAPSLSSLLLNAYLHGSWLHLVSNMVYLVVFGPPLEERLGAKRFLVLYHLCNVIANAMQGALVLIFHPVQASWGVLGASGAIAGLLGLFLVRLYFARLRVGYWAFMPLQAYTRCGLANVPAAFAIVVWFGIQLGLALVQGEGAAAGIACGSHLGGLAGGIGLALLLDLRAAAQAERHLQQGRRYLDRALWYPAQGEFIEYVRRQPRDDIGHLELARTYRLTGRHPQADAHYRTACEILAAAKRFDQVEEIYLEAERGNAGFTLSGALQLQLAQLFERTFKPEPAERAYLRYAHHEPATPGAPLALYRAARLASQDPAQAWRSETLYARLVEQYPLAAEAGLARVELHRLQAAA